MCYDVQTLQQILDGNFDGDIQKSMAHINSCPHCKEAFEKLQLEEIDVFELLDIGIDMPPPNPIRQLAASKAQSDYAEALENIGKPKNNKFMGVIKLNSGLKRFSVALAGVVICSSIFFSEPLKVKAQELLQMFRVENMQTISFSREDAYELEKAFESGSGTAEIENFGKVEMDSEVEPVSIDGVSSPDDIKAVMPDAKVANPPEGFKIEDATVTDDINMKFTLDIEKINDFLKYMGEDNLLPESISNKPFFVRTGSFLNYGLEIEPDDSNSSSYAHVSISQTQAPEIEIPSDVDKNELVHSLLSLKLIPRNLKTQLLAIDDITTTIPILYSEDDETAEDISIRGHQGILIQPKDANDDYIRVCFKEDGYLFFISSYSVDEDTLLEIIESME
ncbi:hypothetical protein SAMN02745945_02843 [Peptoclostridium litorale DSM 5388]|uniref:Anti-sigma factor n=1 Tax=Peptoclostridium litorale DSM 5388 TaxID=1121324 RepID=A0A069RID6_PEPLI|nr:hypothetical protein [Peptoclostridium litorale]KDR96776.1 anti-sigma factor [Peptoclostridium litorale DSM 5388]SIO34519.1 hypothetical protein SAMN02745945_02843 [Peptoclostridium litorale DSM 5388]